MYHQKLQWQVFMEAMCQEWSLKREVEKVPKLCHILRLPMSMKKEVVVIVNGDATSHEDLQKAISPSWLLKADVVGIKDGFDLLEVNDDKNASNAIIIKLQKKRNEEC